jgi:hypothetical protein
MYNIKRCHDTEDSNGREMYRPQSTSITGFCAVAEAKRSAAAELLTRVTYFAVFILTNSLSLLQDGMFTNVRTESYTAATRVV